MRLRPIAFSALSLLFLSSLCINGLFVLHVPAWMNVPLRIAFYTSVLVSLVVAALYLARNYGPWRQGRTWGPLVMCGSVFLVAIAVLITIDLTVPLWDEYLALSYVLARQSNISFQLTTSMNMEWLSLVLAAALLSGLAVIFLVLVRGWTIVSKSIRRRFHGPPTA